MAVVFQYQLISHVPGSTTTAGNAGSGGSGGFATPISFSPDGRYVLFDSNASNLAASDSNAGSDLFIYDTQDFSVDLVSHTSGSATTAANAATGAQAATFSPDGHFVLFQSAASDIASTDINGSTDVFLYDSQNASFFTVSHRFGSIETANGQSSGAIFSPDGQNVLFGSNATNLVSPSIAGGNFHLFLREIQGSQVDSIRLIDHTVSSITAGANGSSSGVSFSPDGRDVLYTSDATNLVANQADANGVADLFLHDLPSNTNTLISHAFGSLHAAANGSIPPSGVSFSPDGRYVLYTSNATNLVASQVDANGVADLFLYDTQLGTNTLISHIPGSATTADNSSPVSHASFSPDGRYILFASDATNLTAVLDTNGVPDLFLYDTQSNTTTLISHIPGSTTTADNSSPVSHASFSPDGRYILFDSAATNFVAGVDPNGLPDLFLYDRQDSSIDLVSHIPGSATTAGDGESLTVDLSFSQDSRYVLFNSSASDLTAIDTNGAEDAFLYDTLDGSVQLVSANNSGAAANGTSIGRGFGPDGRSLVIQSDATDLGGLALTDTNNSADIFLVTFENAVNNAPVADNDSYNVAEDNVLTFAAPGVLDGDTDADSDPLSAVFVSGPVNGLLTLHADGSFTYRPKLDFNGTDSFTYKANDGTADSDLATVTISVTAVNDSPIPSPTVTHVTTAEDTAIGGQLAARDVENDPFTFSASSDLAPQHGSVMVNADGIWTYTPNADFYGADSFGYRVTDDKGASANGTVDIEVRPINDAPVAVDDEYNVAEDGTLVVNVGAVSRLHMFSDPGDFIGQGLIWDITSSSASFSASRNFDNGVDILVDPPGAVEEWLLNFAAPFSVQLTVGDYLNATRFPFQTDDAPALDVTGYGRGLNQLVGEFTVYDVVYGPGSSVLRFAASFVQQNVNFDGMVDPPLRGTIVFNSTFGAGGGVLANDTDVEGDLLPFAVLVSGPAHGNLTFNGDGTFTYIPEADFYGIDTFTYRTGDGQAESNNATVTITVNPIADPPVAQDDSATTAEDTAITINVVSNDTDADDDALSPILVDEPTHGSLLLNADGTLTYTPNPNFNGTDSFTYKANDGQTNSNIASVAITITSINDTPTDIAISADAVAENSLIGTVVGSLSATDPDAGDILSLTLLDSAGGLFGIGGINGNSLVVAGALDYEEATSHDITVRVTDSANSSYDETFTIDITNVGGVAITGTARADTINATTSVGGQFPTNEEDHIVGGRGKDTIEALGGNDFVDGGRDADRLEGGAGIDVLVGGEGDDTFVFKAGFGNDFINDFEEGKKKVDVIEIHDNMFADFADVFANSEQVGSNVVITTADGQNSITLVDVFRENLNANDFQFV